MDRTATAKKPARWNSLAPFCPPSGSKERVGDTNMMHMCELRGIFKELESVKTAVERLQLDSNTPARKHTEPSSYLRKWAVTYFPSEKTYCDPRSDNCTSEINTQMIYLKFRQVQERYNNIRKEMDKHPTKTPLADLCDR